jgi:hypothetical protein
VSYIPDIWGEMDVMEQHSLAVSGRLRILQRMYKPQKPPALSSVDCVSWVLSYCPQQYELPCNSQSAFQMVFLAGTAHKYFPRADSCHFWTPMSVTQVQPQEADKTSRHQEIDWLKPHLNTSLGLVTVQGSWGFCLRDPSEFQLTTVPGTTTAARGNSTLFGPVQDELRLPWTPP